MDNDKIIKETLGNMKPELLEAIKNVCVSATNKNKEEITVDDIVNGVIAVDKAMMAIVCGEFSEKEAADMIFFLISCGFPAEFLNSALCNIRDAMEIESMEEN
jgi:hypothetical protein